MHEAGEAMEIRLGRIERRLRIVQVGWAMTGIVLVLLGIGARQVSSQPAIVRGRGVEVVDEAGRARIELGVRYGIALLRMADPAGRPRVELAVFPDGFPGLQFADADGRPRIRLGVGTAGEPELWLLDRLERPRIGLKVLSTGVPRIWLFDAATGKVSFQAP
jgi:hypothetical protein